MRNCLPRELPRKNLPKTTDTQPKVSKCSPQFLTANKNLENVWLRTLTGIVNIAMWTWPLFWGVLKRFRRWAKPKVHAKVRWIKTFTFKWCSSDAACAVFFEIGKRCCENDAGLDDSDCCYSKDNLISLDMNAVHQIKERVCLPPAEHSEVVQAEKESRPVIFSEKRYAQTWRLKCVFKGWTCNRLPARTAQRGNQFGQEASGEKLIASRVILSSD